MEDILAWWCVSEAEDRTAERAAYGTQAGNCRVPGDCHMGEARCRIENLMRRRTSCRELSSLPVARLASLLCSLPLAQQAAFLPALLTTSRPARTTNRPPPCLPPRTRYPLSLSSRSTLRRTQSRVRSRCGAPFWLCAHYKIYAGLVRRVRTMTLKLLPVEVPQDSISNSQSPNL